MAKNKSKKYLYAVEWIALNDNPGSVDATDTDALFGQVSVALISDVFSIPRTIVAKDVADFRLKHGDT